MTALGMFQYNAFIVNDFSNPKFILLPVCQHTSKNKVVSIDIVISHAGFINPTALRKANFGLLSAIGLNNWVHVGVFLSIYIQ